MAVLVVTPGVLPEQQEPGDLRLTPAWPGSVDVHENGLITGFITAIRGELPDDAPGVVTLLTLESAELMRPRGESDRGE